MAAFVGKKVGIHSLVVRIELNGLRGTIVGWNENHRYLVDAYMPGGGIKQFALTHSNVSLLDEHWVDLVETGPYRRLFNKQGIMCCLQGPGFHPSPFTTFTAFSSPPTRQQILEFWGPLVYTYMKKVLQDMLAVKRRPGLLWAFKDVNLDATEGIVFSDGLKDTQASPQRPGEWGFWWPVLITHDSTELWPSASTQRVAFCQAQALSNSRPYYTHPSRCCLFSIADDSRRPMQIEHSTVRIEELDTSEGNIEGVGSNVSSDPLEADWTFA